MALVECVLLGEEKAKVMVWDVTSVDDESGTLLVKGLARLSIVRASAFLDARWRAALGYYRRSR